ncbi:MAG: helix-turn-helix domain-containing protein [Oscillospiraceae bacterium]
MKISCNKLWKLLIDKGINRRELRCLSGISTTSITKMGKGENITTDVLIKICKALNCGVNDIMGTVDVIHDTTRKDCKKMRLFCSPISGIK